MFSNHCSCGVLSGSPNRGHWFAGGEGVSGGRSCLMSDKNTWTLTYAHGRTHTAMAWCRHLNKLWHNLSERAFSIMHPGVTGNRIDVITKTYQKRPNLKQWVQLGRAVALSVFIFLINKSHYTLMLPPFLFPCLWTSALRASVSRHKPEGDTLSFILRYMVLNEEREGKQTGCLHINTLCHCPPLTKTLTC